MRAARPEDRAAVAQLCSFIWEGEDYIPEVFDDWIVDPRGQFTVACKERQLVALSKLTEVAQDEWWLEGLRVHPDYRGRGVARRLHEYAVALADRMAHGVIRFATSGSNRPVHALAARSGFHLVSRHYVAQADSLSKRACHGFQVAREDELRELENWLTGSANLTAVGGLIEERWSWSALLPQLEALVNAGRVVSWAEGEKSRAGLAVFSQGDAEGETRFWVNYADAAPALLATLWHQLRALAAERGAESLRAKPLATPAIAEALTAAGWGLEPDHTMWVFARPLPQRAGA